MPLTCRHVVFIGCDYFGFRGFRELVAMQSDKLRVVGLITAGDAASLPLRNLARGLCVPVCTGLPKDSATLAWLEDVSPDFGVVMEYGHKLSEHFLQRFSLPVVNFHPSNLPEFRGGAPMEALITEQRPLVISANAVSPRFDDGPILGKTEPFDIEGMELDLVYRLAAHLVRPLLRNVVSRLLRGDVQGTVQDEAAASYRWYKDLERKLAIVAEDTVAACERKLLASNPKHGIPLHVALGAATAPMRVSAGFGLCCAHPHAPGSIIEITDETLTVAVSDGLMFFHQGTVNQGQVHRPWRAQAEATSPPSPMHELAS